MEFDKNGNTYGDTAFPKMRRILKVVRNLQDIAERRRLNALDIEEDS
jgi:hypothetical protein